MGWCWTNRIGLVKESFLPSPRRTATAHPRCEEQKHFSRPRLIRAVWGRLCFFNLFHSYHLCTDITFRLFDKPQPCRVPVSRGREGKPAGLGTSCRFPWSETATHREPAGESSKQLRWGILGFLLSAGVICGAHPLLEGGGRKASICKNTPANTIPRPAPRFLRAAFIPCSRCRSGMPSPFYPRVFSLYKARS